MGKALARFGDTSDHGGAITTSASKSLCEGALVARVGDLLLCPVHGLNPIIDGAPKLNCEGAAVARTDSLTFCGAKIIGGATKTFTS